MIVELNARSREVFRHIVDGYVATGEPVGSRTIARRLEEQLSPATIRNVMADLEELGLLYAPHTSAGRLPTEAGLRFYVDGLLEVGIGQDVFRQGRTPSGDRRPHCQATRSHATGWPARRRSPRRTSMPTSWPRNGLQTGVVVPGPSRCPTV